MAYPIVNKLITECNSDMSAAEAHGMATGMLCVNAETLSSYWLAELLNDAKPVSDDDQQVLVRLFEETKQLLACDEFTFALFLPDDDTLLSARVSALKTWCQGFLYGVGAAHLTGDYSSDVREVLKDISEFTRLDTMAEGEEDENAFVEITEYLKSVVLLLRDDLTSHNPDKVH
ncbi:MAG: UPF0149 family protein [Methylovulum sp.]|nr:UPF0149 family protein [Methylovulum sp.]